MKHMTSYVFNKDIKTIDDAVTAINTKLMGPVITVIVQVSRKGVATTFISAHRQSSADMPSKDWYKEGFRECLYEVTKLDDLLKIICDRLSLLEICVRYEIVVPK